MSIIKWFLVIGVIVAAVFFWQKSGKQEEGEINNNEEPQTVNQIVNTVTPAEEGDVTVFEFSSLAYDKVLNDPDKIIALYFYANWCPLCKAEFPKFEEAIRELDSDQIIAFRVNYKDGQTEQAEEDLARQFGVAYQHTKVFLKNGQLVLKNGESWDKTRYLSEISKLING